MQPRFKYVEGRKTGSFGPEGLGICWEGNKDQRDYWYFSVDEWQPEGIWDCWYCRATLIDVFFRYVFRINFGSTRF